MFRALLVLILAIGHFVTSNVSRVAGYGTPLDRAVNTGVPPPEQPAGWAFAIWGLIFSLALLYAARQILPSRRDSALYQAIGWPVVLAFLACNGWMLWAQLVGNDAVLLALMWVFWVFAIIVFFRALAMRPMLDRFDSIVTLPLFGILGGWLSAAALVNTVSWLRVANLLPPGLSLSLSAAAAMVAIAVLSLLVLRRAHGYFWFGATTLWALGGIAYANLYFVPNREIAILAIGLALLVVAMLAWPRRPVSARGRLA
jgi:hypothetical protein